MGSNKNGFVKHAAVYGFGTLALQAVSVILLPLYTSYLTPAEYGVLEVINRTGDVVVICLMVNGLRLAALTFYQQAKDQAERDRTAATITVMLIVVLVAIGSLVVLLSPALSDLLRIAGPELIAFGIVAALLEATTAVPLVLIQARVESVLYMTALLAMAMVRIGLTVVAVAVCGWGVWGVLAAAALTSGVFGTALTIREFSHGSFRPDFRRMLEAVKFTLPFLPGGLFFFILHNGDRFFLIRASGEEGVGLYALAYRLALAVGEFSVVPLYRVWSVRMFDTFKLREAPVLFGRTVTRILAVYLFVGLTLCVFAGEVIAILGSEAYAEAAGLIGPIVAAYWFLSAANLMDASFYICRRTSLKLWITIPSTATMLLLYAWWIPPFGPKGAAYATLGGFLVHAALTFLVSQRVFRVHYEPVRLATMLVLAVVAVAVSQRLDACPMGVFVKAALWLCWPIGLWVLGAVTEDEKAWLIGAVRGAISYCRSTLWGTADKSDL